MGSRTVWWCDNEACPRNDGVPMYADGRSREYSGLPYGEINIRTRRFLCCSSACGNAIVAHESARPVDLVCVWCYRELAKFHGVGTEGLAYGECEEWGPRCAESRRIQRA